MSRFSLPQLEAFLWVARLGSFRAAGERLNVTQPTISLRIRDLETALGTRLLERLRPFNLVVTNVPGPPQRLHLLGAELR